MSSMSSIFDVTSVSLHDPYLLIILVIIIGGWVLNLIVELLNRSSMSAPLPEEFRDVYNKKEYARAQDYNRTNTRFNLIMVTIITIILLGLILFGVFGMLDSFLRSFGLWEVFTGLLFFGILGFGLELIMLPFKIYDTFVIEEKYGFNRTTPKTFALDQVKELILGFVIMGGLLFLLLSVLYTYGQYAWLICWVIVVLFQFVITILAPIVIMPMFNKFEPLKDVKLRLEILELAKALEMKIVGIYQMDGSRRSNKANAFFTGIGNTKRIVLFDTLLEHHPNSEILAIFAHEAGHYKLKHIPRNLAFSTVSMGMSFLFLSQFINDGSLIRSIGFEEVSVYAGLVGFGLLYSPIMFLFGILGNQLSRKYEREADDYARVLVGGKHMIAALKRLSSENMSNLTPHPVKVFFEYSHPPVLERVRRLK